MASAAADRKAYVGIDIDGIAVSLMRLDPIAPLARPDGGIARRAERVVPQV